MKKSPILLLSLGFVLASCSPTTSSSKSADSSSVSESVSVSSSVVDSSDPASSSSEESSSAASSSSSEETFSSSDSDYSSSESSSEEPQLTIDDIVAEIAKADVSLVSGGQVTKTEKYSPTSGDDVSAYTYQYGSDDNGDAYHENLASEYNSYDVYLMNDGDGIFGFKVSEGSYELVTRYDTMAFIFEDYISNGGAVYGAEGFAQKIVDYAKDNINKDLKFDYTDGAYNLSFGYYFGITDDTFYDIDASFVMEGNALKTFTLDVTSYSSYDDAFTVDEEKGTMILNDGASYSGKKSFVVEQTIGERSWVNTYTPDQFYATSFDIVDDDNKAIGDTYTFSISDYNAHINLGNVLPETASLAIDKPDITITAADEGDDSSDDSAGEVTQAAYFADALDDEDDDIDWGDDDEDDDWDDDDWDDEDDDEPGLSADSSWNNPTEIDFSAEETGTYNVEISTRDVTKNLTVVVTPAKPESISASYYVVSPEGYSNVDLTDVETADAYVGNEYCFAASVSPYAADQSVKVSVTDSDGTEQTVTTKEIQISEYGSPFSVYAWTPSKADDYDLVIASTADDTVEKQVSFHVTDAPTVADVLGNSNGFAIRSSYSGPVQYTLAFTPNASDDGVTGSVALADIVNNKSEKATYAAAKNDKGFYDLTFTKTDGDDVFDSSYAFTIGTDGNLYVSVTTTYEGSDPWTSTSKVSVATPSFYLNQKWQGTSNGLTFSASFGTDGQVNIRLSDDNEINEFIIANYSISDAAGENGYEVTIKDVVDDEYYTPFFTLPATFTLSSDFSSLTASFNYNSTDYTFVTNYAESGRWD